MMWEFVKYTLNPEFYCAEARSVFTGGLGKAGFQLRLLNIRKLHLSAALKLSHLMLSIQPYIRPVDGSICRNQPNLGIANIRYCVTQYL